MCYTSRRSNVPIARLVFTPQDDGRLHGCAIDAIEVSHSVAGSGKEAEREHGGTPYGDREELSIAGHDQEPGIAA